MDHAKFRSIDMEKAAEKSAAYAEGLEDPSKKPIGSPKMAKEVHDMLGDAKSEIVDATPNTVKENAVRDIEKDENGTEVWDFV